MSTGRVAWIGALAVLLLQAQLVLHPQLDHDLSGVGGGESCEVCVKLDKSGNAPLAAAPQTLADSTATALQEPVDALLFSRAATRYAPRAPPLA